ncbi:MAG: ATP-binding protein [Candidatus Omnitrophica bacterium]|nr:ATP-binding protein [Candidatus Omnitrophota bacterium]
MENPFVYGDVVKGQYFTDREEELKELKLDLSSGQNVLIFSPRRYGKTSLIIKVLDELKKEGFIAVYVDLFRVTSIQSFIKIYTSSITKASATKLEEAMQFLKEHFPALIPRIVIRGQEPAEFEFDFEAAKKDAERLLDDLYDFPQRVAVKRKKRLIVVFDEFQEISTLNLPIERQLRAKIQHHDKVSYCFMGSKRHLMDELFQDKNKPLYKIAKSIPLGKITSERFKTFIHSRFKSVDMRIESCLIDEILNVTACHPYYTQQLCHEIFNVSFSKKSPSIINPEDINSAKDKCIQAQSYAYGTIWDNLAAKQKSLVVALCKEPGANIYSQDFLSSHSLGTPASIQTAVNALEKKGILDREDGSYFVSDVFFIDWLRKKIA